MAKVKAPAAKVTFQAFAYLGKYTSLERVVSGQEMPLICKEEGGYFLEQGCPIIGTIECTLTLYSADKVVQNQIEALQAQLQDARAKAHQAEQAILEKISKLQALEFNGSVVEAA
jgi:hypothetical protein